MGLRDKIDLHRRFWAGEGPCLLLIPTSQMPQYDTTGYRARFDDPALMWEAEMRRARPVLDWPTDGIPTVRPNLGVVFIPAIGGLESLVHDDQMPWPGRPLSRDAIRAIRASDIRDALLLRHAEQFYTIHRERGGDEIVPYLPDTQGVFDIAHMLYGKDILYDLVDDPAWIRELMEISLDLYVRVTRRLKDAIGEPAAEMIHGHGTQQGVYFPHAGTRISEDAATLLSPAMIRTHLMSYIERSAAAFGGCFAHYCGRHPSLHEELCRSPQVRAIDMGNTELYDCRWILEQCAQTRTVLYSRVAALEGEDWAAYIHRIATLIRETGARCVLRPMVFPVDRDACAAMQDLWHELTA